VNLRRLAGVLACVWIALGAGGCRDAEEVGAKRPAPDFEHVDLDGNLVRLSDLRGRTVVIDFWATWCAPCVFQPPQLNEVWRAHRDSGKVVVLGLEMGGATAEEIRAWGEENEAVAEYPLLLGASEELAQRYGVPGFPATVVVGPDGAIDSVMVGLSSAEEIEQSIADLVGS
jgi:peroxiredoxin